LILPLLLLQAAPLYPVPSAERDLTAPAQPMVLTDLSWAASETTSTEQAIAARARIGSFGFLSAQVSGELRGVGFETQHLRLDYTERQGSHSLDLAWRAHRLLATLALDRRGPGQGEGVVAATALGVRLNRDLELTASFQQDSDADNVVPLAGRVVRAGGLGALWQHGTRLELSGELFRERLRTSGFIDEDRSRAAAGAVFSPSIAELGLACSLEAVDGRFARRQWLVETDNAVRLLPRLVLSQASRTRYEPGIGAFENRFGGGLTLYARRHSFARSGEAARRMRALAYRGFELGMNERRAPGDDERRAFRERLALAPERTLLRDDLLALHAAQEAERNVPLLGAALSRGWNETNGTSDWRWSATLGVPWRPLFPWQSREATADFLRVQYEGTRTHYKPGVTAVDHGVNLRVFLNREIEAFFGWSKPGITPADIIRLQSSGRRLDVAVSYLFGQ